jgi:hypothetical protein
MSNLTQRVFCPECGAMRIHNHRSRFAVCPNGHGRLVPRLTEADRRKAIVRRLPRAWRVGRHVFVIDGYDDRFAYQNGRRPAMPDATVASNEVLARYVTRARTLIRVFVPKNPRKT